MRVVWRWVLLLALGAGCASKSPKWPASSTASPSAGGGQKAPPDQTWLVGKVVKVNQNGRFVVLNFPLGRMPAKEQRLYLYRAGVKVGEVRVTGPQLDDNIVGDLTAGEAAQGDNVRDK